MKKLAYQTNSCPLFVQEKATKDYTQNVIMVICFNFNIIGTCSKR